jgi:hypothetical protein
MTPLDQPGPEKETARLLADARRAIKQQQEAAATSVHIAQAVLHAFQQATRITERACAAIPDEARRRALAEEMSRVTRALAGVVEEFSPGLSAEAAELPEPAAPAPLPEEFFLWLRTQQQHGATLPRADAITAGRQLWSRATQPDRDFLLQTWRQLLRERATALFQLSSSPYAT